MQRFIGGRFKCVERIGGGSFGEIYSGVDTKTKKSVAIKFETMKSEIPQLASESVIYKTLSGGVNIPKYYWFGTEINHRAMVIQLLGGSLEGQLMKCNKKFSLKTVLMLADQMIGALQYLHSMNLIHRDIKPENFMMGQDNQANVLYMIDFGLAKYFRNPETHAHIQYCENKKLTGTARFASVFTLSGIEQSRRDDMEALAYIWLYFLKGNLPWMDIPAADLQQKYDKICASKSRSSPEELFSGFPSEFATYLTMVKKLRFQDEPNYALYRKMFRDLFIKQGYVFDDKYDWMVPPEEREAPSVTIITPPRSNAASKRVPVKHVTRSSSATGRIVNSNSTNGLTKIANKNISSNTQNGIKKSDAKPKTPGKVFQQLGRFPTTPDMKSPRRVAPQKEMKDAMIEIRPSPMDSGPIIEETENVRKSIGKRPTRTTKR